MLFTFTDNKEEFVEKAIGFIEEFINTDIEEEEHVLVILNVIIHLFPDQFINFLKQILLLNKDVKLLKQIYLDTGGTYSGSRVPKIQREIDLCNEIIIMVKSLPDILDYADHLKYLDQKNIWLKKDLSLIHI